MNLLSHFHYGSIKINEARKVFGTKFLEKSEMTFIGLGALYPDGPLTIVIFEKDKANFPQSSETFYAGKQIFVTGVIIEYNGKLEMVVESRKRIVVE